jgi:hypothetical protein
MGDGEESSENSCVRNTSNRRGIGGGGTVLGACSRRKYLKGTFRKKVGIQDQNPQLWKLEREVTF